MRPVRTTKHRQKTSAEARAKTNCLGAILRLGCFGCENKPQTRRSGHQPEGDRRTALTLQVGGGEVQLRFANLSLYTPIRHSNAAHFQNAFGFIVLPKPAMKEAATKAALARLVEFGFYFFDEFSDLIDRP
jgi:hypothetical protein